MRARVLLGIGVLSGLLAACTQDFDEYFQGQGGSGAAAPGCRDGVQNGEETGVDCGGSCGPCPGNPCSDPSACASGFCVEGVCCDAACDGVCEACTQALTGQTDGQCAPVEGGTDPDNECAATDPTSCGATGMGCSGTAAMCAVYGTDTLCAPAGCTAGQNVAASFCDGAGECAAGATTACDPYVCDAAGTACLTDCTSGGVNDCAPGHICDGTTCLPLAGNGEPCFSDQQCVSGFCPQDDDVCCDAQCDSNCQACVAAKTGGIDGVCAFVAPGIDPDNDCQGPSPAVCDGAGVCADDVCNVDVTPPGNQCPSQCTGGCESGDTVCVIDCGFAVDACKQTSVTCPPGFDCRVDCTAEGGCEQTVIACPSLFGCEVQCGAKDGCANASILCSGDGMCDLHCSGAQNVCNGTTLDCGNDACTATCVSTPYPTVACGGACGCTPC